METITQTLANLPHTSGVYLFHSSDGSIIYIGKAVDLARRVRQYFQKADALGEKTETLVAEIAHIEIIPTTSEFDALLLEAKLVRRHLPKFNSALRDDKSPLYICFTLSESLPRVVWLRSPQVPHYTKNKKNKVFGPFQSPLALRSLMRHIRHAVPYCTQKQRTGKPCFYTHIGLCGPCPSAITAMGGREKDEARLDYRKHIHTLSAIFDGQSKTVMRAYEKEMKAAAKKQDFEGAGVIKQRIETLYRIAQLRYDPAIFLERGATDIYKEELDELRNGLLRYFPNLSDISRIECYDISHLSGTASVGSMVVLDSGRPDTSQYRRFRIKTVRGISDVAMIAEVLRRRLAHAEWPMPGLIIVDGGKPQVASGLTVLQDLDMHIPLVGLAKRNEEIIIPRPDGFWQLNLPLNGKAIKVAQRIRDEAHRFALAYNRLLRTKQLLSV